MEDQSWQRYVPTCIEVYMCPCGDNSRNVETQPCDGYPPALYTHKLGAHARNKYVVMTSPIYNSAATTCA